MFNIFEIDDIRKYIFSFLRSKPKEKCQECDCVLIWDKKVINFINVDNNDYINFIPIKNGYYCIDCYFKKVDLRCIIS